MMGDVDGNENGNEKWELEMWIEVYVRGKEGLFQIFFFS
jgi:hypothetical protein